MHNDRFRIKLKSKESNEELTIITSLLSPMDGLLHYPIELDKWDIVQCDQTTGLFDINKKEIFFNDEVRYKNEDSLYEVTINDFTKIPVVDGATGQIPLYKVASFIESVEAQ